MNTQALGCPVMIKTLFAIFILSFPLSRFALYILYIERLEYIIAFATSKSRFKTNK